MHGDAQTANAPPSATREPRLRAPCSKPAPTSRSGQGSSPMKASPKTTSTKPEMRSSRNWLRKRPSPTSWAPTPSRTKTAVNPSTKGMLASDHPAGRALLAEPLRLDRGDRRQVAGHEREHARCEKGDESREQRDGQLRQAHAGLIPRSGRARRPAAARAPDREVPQALASALVAAPAPRPRERSDGHGTDGKPGKRKQPGEEVESMLRRLGEHGRAELVDELRLDLRRAVPGRDARANERLHACRDRRVRLVERRLARRADDLALEIGLAGPVGGEGRRHERRRERQGEREDERDPADHCGVPSASARPRRMRPCCARCRSRPRGAPRRGGPAGRRRTSPGSPSRPICRSSTC